MLGQNFPGQCKSSDHLEGANEEARLYADCCLVDVVAAGCEDCLGVLVGCENCREVLADCGDCLSILVGGMDCLGDALIAGCEDCSGDSVEVSGDHIGELGLDVDGVTEDAMGVVTLATDGGSLHWCLDAKGVLVDDADFVSDSLGDNGVAENAMEVVTFLTDIYLRLDGVDATGILVADGDLVSLGVNGVAESKPVPADVGST